MLHIRRLALLLPVIVLASACGRSERVETGAAWEKIYDRPAGSATAIEMFDDQYGLAIIGHGIERTTDGGRTWHETDSSDDVSGYIGIADSDHAWIAGASGALLRTDDGGLTWQHQQTATQAPFNNIAAVGADEAWATAYAAGSGQGFPPHGASALVHTVDGGATWQSVDVPGYGIFLGVWFVGDDGWLLATQCHPGDPLDDPLAEPGAPGHLPCNDESTLLHTPDDGRSWSALPASAAATGGAIVRVDRLDGYSLAGCGRSCNGPRLYKTSDGGQTWADISGLRLGPNDGIRSFRFAGLDGWLGVMQLAPPTDPPSAATYIDRLAHTGDGGRTWEYVDLPGGSSFAFDLAGAAVVASAAGTGISRYDPDARSWQPASTDAGPELTHIAFATRDIGYATTFEGALWATTDGGTTWSLRSDALRWEISQNGSLWAFDSTRTIHLSDDGGRSTRDLSPPPGAQSSASFSVLAAAGDRVWLVLSDGLWRTGDAGITWRQVDAASNALYHFIDAQHAWTAACGAGACDGAIRFTSDGGDSWEARPFPANAYSGDLVFGTALDGWGPVRDPHGDCRCMVATHDGGRSWQTVSTAPWTLTEILPIDGRRAWAIGVTGLSLAQPPEVVSTSDGGATWIKEFSLDRRTQTHLVARDDRIWLYLSTSPVSAFDGAYDTPRRTIIYRRDIAPEPPPIPLAGSSP